LKAQRLVPILLCAAYVAQCGWFIATQSLVFDEPYHLARGLDAWRNARFDRWPSHPPLAPLLLTAPLARGDWQVEVTSETPATVIRPDPVAMAWRARWVNVLLGVLLGVLLWRTARRLFSEAAANLALALFAFSPPLIAHFSVITTDGMGTLTTFLTAVQLARWRREPSRPQTLLLGLVLGLLLLAKFYTVPLFALALVLALVLKPEGFALAPRNWNWGKAAAMALIAVLLVWGAYFFGVTRVDLGDAKVALHFPNAPQPRVEDFPSSIRATLYIPACEYLVGLGSVVDHDRRGHRSYFLGELSTTGGWKLYFPVIILLKWPTVVLLLFAATLVLAWRKRWALPRELLLMAWFPSIFFLLALFVRINIGDRHILPVYPFVLLFCAGLWELARGRRWALALVTLAVLANAADALRVAPDYLSSFNILVKTGESHKLVGDSGLDWGQGLLALRKYEAEHPNEKIYLAYFGNVDPALYGIRATPLAENQRVAGTVVVSATHLTGSFLRDPAGYQWLLRYPRKAILNHTLHVFDTRAELPPK
jgi:hypothetical protein